MPITATMSPARGAVDFRALVGVHLHDAAEAVLLAGALVVVHFALVDRSLVDAEERQLAVRVFHDLEGHAHERLLGIGFERELLVGLGVVLGRNLPLQRRRQVTHHGVQQGLHALVAVGRAHEHGRQILVAHAGLDDRMDQVERHFLFRQHQLHQFVAVHRQLLEHVLPGCDDVVFHLGRNRLAADLFAVIAVEIDGFLGDQVDHAFEVSLPCRWAIASTRRRSRAFRAAA